MLSTIMTTVKELAGLALKFILLILAVQFIFWAFQVTGAIVGFLVCAAIVVVGVNYLLDAALGGVIRRSVPTEFEIKVDPTRSKPRANNKG